MADRPAPVDLVDAGDGYLTNAAALGDREAFEVLVRRHGPALFRYARQMLASEDDIADVVQNTFIAAWRQLATFRGSSTVQTWLFAICARKIVDSYRIKRAQPIDDQLLEALPATAVDADPFAAASNSAFLAALDRALAELPPRQRASWLLREIHGMTFPQIGEVLGLTSDAVRGHHLRATATLRRRLERWR